MFFPAFPRTVLTAENRRDEKFCLEAEKQPPKSTKYATSATNLQMGPYVISKRSQIHGFACIHLGWSPARRRAAQPPLLPGDTKHRRQAGSRAPTFLPESPHLPHGDSPSSLRRALLIPVPCSPQHCHSRKGLGWGGFPGSSWELTTHRSGHS